MRDWDTVEIDSAMESDVRHLVRLAIAEDLGASPDWTTACLVNADERGTAAIVPREDGIVAGMAILPWVLDEFDVHIECHEHCQDRDRMTSGDPLVTLSGSVRDLLTSERIVLNLLARLCGIATLTHAFVQQITGTGAKLYDTRKTTPGWRRLEKYAVTCGGGRNHRTGLFDGFLAKDNHLALGRSPEGQRWTAATAAEHLVRLRGASMDHLTAPQIVEIEVDSMPQLEAVLPVGPDIVLLDNFGIADLKTAVALRDRVAPEVELEASGNVRLATIGAIASTGVDRISSGALTHQATSLDLGLDWSEAFGS